jgi:hypothetical protein
MQVTGIVDVIWAGRRLLVEKGSTFKLGGIENEAVTFGRAVARSQKNVPTEVKVVTALPRGVRYDDVVFTGEAELQIQTDIGTIYVMSEAFIVGRPEIGDQGKMTIMFNAGSYEEILA